MKSEKVKEFIDGCINNLTAELADIGRMILRAEMLVEFSGRPSKNVEAVNLLAEAGALIAAPVDREYWRRVYAGQAMMGIFAGRNWRKDGAPDCIEHARNAVELADALIAELDKTNNNEK